MQSPSRELSLNIKLVKPAMVERNLFHMADATAVSDSSSLHSVPPETLRLRATYSLRFQIVE